MGICEQDQRKVLSVCLYTGQRSSVSAQFSIGHFSLIVFGTEVLTVETDLTELFLFLETILSVREGWRPRILIPEQAQANTVHASHAFV